MDQRSESIRNKQSSLSLRFFVNLLWKAFFLFVICNLVFVFTSPLSWLGKASLYNIIYPGRPRLPWSENPSVAYNLSLNNLDAMFASHEVSGGDKPEDEYRVLVFGDSSVWGFLLEPGETYTANINEGGYITEDGRVVRAYNLGYPTISLTKDLLLIDYAMRYGPDMIVWLVTLESFPTQKQLFTPLLQHNPNRIRNLISTYDLTIDENHEGFIEPNLWENTIIGQRRTLADLLRLQLYGTMWAATGIDQDIPEIYSPLQKDFEEDVSYYDYSPPELSLDDLAFDVISAGVARSGNVPVLMINEPIFISQGENSQVRYNFLYPRWAYDSYRRLMIEQSELNGWHYIDLWDAISPDEFTNTAIHVTPLASAQLASRIAESILDLANNEGIGTID
jgi:hypothetical protein